MREASRAAFLLTVALMAASSAMPVRAAVGITWQNQKSLMPNYVCETATCSYGGRIYVFGGTYWDESGNQLTTNKLQIYDPAADAWSLGADLLEETFLSTAVEVGGKIYVMGGRDLQEVKDVNQVYDPATDTWSSGASLPYPLRGQGAAAYGGKIYLLGGRSENYLGDVNIYDPASDSWSSGTPSPAAQAYGTACTVGDRIYWFGNVRNWEHTGPEDVDGLFRIYDPVSDRWDTPSPMSYPVMTCGSGVAIGTRIYIFGGPAWDEEADMLAPTSVCQAYDTATHSGLALAGMPSPEWRSLVMTGAVGGKAYLVGGNRNLLGDTDYLRIVEVYDPASDTYYCPNSPVPGLETSGEGYADSAAGAIGGKIYAAFGAFETETGKLATYDIAGNVWVTAGVPLDLPRFSASGVSGGKLIVTGGIADENVATGMTVSFDPATGIWSTLADDPTPRYHQGACILNGKLYVFGGSTAPAGVPTDDARVLDIASNTWTQIRSLPEAMWRLMAAAGGGKIYLFGGIRRSPVDSPDDFNTRMLVYDPATDTYDTSKAAMPHPVYYAAAAAYDNYIFVHGGYYWKTSNVNLYKDVQVYDVAADRWTELEGLFFRQWHNTVAAGGRLYVFGGCDPEQHWMDRLCIGEISGLTPPPVVTSAGKKGNPFRFVVAGSNLQQGVLAYIGNDATPWSQLVWKSTSQVIMKGGSALKAKIPKGTPTPVLFKNPDGGTASFRFSW